MDHNSRYERMEEFVSVCKKLWASVPADAFVWDRESGIVIDKPERIQAINHVGEFFKVKGPLPCVPSPQGRPMLIQAGGSPRGVKASANFADYVFAAHKPGKGMAKHRSDLDSALKAEGRDASQVGILWSTYILVGETEAEATRAKEGLLKMMPLEGAAATISDSAGWDFSTLPNRFKLKEVNDEIAATNASPVGIVYKLMQQLGEDAEITREEFFEYAMLSASGYDHCVAGTAAQVADVLEELFEETGSRGGFMISAPPSIPRDLLNIVDFLVPELQRRGRYRTKYESTLLKENLAIAA
jgi:alkanesulfonate monooxygenase SsuD/methylene tetrahydromethanopterin reductase-like flavin-dependent oxidoreductase (luciferase family)